MAIQEEGHQQTATSVTIALSMEEAMHVLLHLARKAVQELMHAWIVLFCIKAGRLARIDAHKNSSKKAMEIIARDVLLL
jgi:hypothetical protein